MSYISAITKGDNVLVWERHSHGREMVPYTAPFFFFTKDPKGKYTSIYGDKLTKNTFATSKEFYFAKKGLVEKGETLFESDIPAELRILSSQYYEKPAPKLNVTFYDIEVDYDSTIGFSSVDNPYAPVSSVSILHFWSNEMIVLAVPPSNPSENAVKWNPETLLEQVLTCGDDAKVDSKYNIKLILCKDERELLLHFLELIEDSDVICGWNSDMFDTPYMAKRIESQLGKAHFDRLDFVGCTPRYREVVSRKLFDKDGKPKRLGETVDLFGRIRTDYMDLYKKYEPSEKASYKLSSIEQEVGLNLPKLEYQGTLSDLYRDNFPYFVRYNIRDTEILGGFEEKLAYVELANQMYHMSCGLFSYVSGTIKLAEYAIVNYCNHELNKIVPDFKRIADDEDRKISGALVLLPQIGEHKWTGSIDINSLYPSAIRSLNISPETLRGQFTDCSAAVTEIYKRSDKLLTMELNFTDEPIIHTASEWREILIANKWAVSGFGTIFDQSIPGIIPSILSTWYTMRKKFQAQKRQAQIDGNEEQENYFDRLQYVYKIKLNSLYGALTNLFFRFFDLRMGDSTTATGRMILTHQCRKTSEVLGDGYDVDFPLYATVKDGGTALTALDGPIFKGAHMAKSVIYGDTDSTYFSTFGTNKQEAIEIADAVAQAVNDSFQGFMQEMFLCNPGFDDIIKAGREIVSDNGIFVDKKRYILHLVDVEGKSVDKTKTMGLDTKKTTLPRQVGEKINGFITMYLTGTPWDEIANMVVEYKDSLRKSPNVMDIGLPKGVQKVEEYTLTYQQQGIAARLPGHVAASIFYNQCMKEYNDTISVPIRSGMKIKVFYLSQKYGKFKSIAIPTDSEVVPQWFFDNFLIDYDAHIKRLVDNPLENIIRAIGKRSPTKQDLLIDRLFDF